jgi:hypothetical protein
VKVSAVRPLSVNQVGAIDEVRNCIDRKTAFTLGTMRRRKEMMAIRWTAIATRGRNSQTVENFDNEGVAPGTRLPSVKEKAARLQAASVG